MATRMSRPMDVPGTMNRQILTRWADATRTALTTELVERELATLGPEDILVEMQFVPIHGSFWLASHPSVLHPRSEEFLRSGSFVFGNGGVGRVLAAGVDAAAATGDHVAVFGHLPCGRSGCHACAVRHRYTECDFGEGRILGHGKGAPDGTYARFAVLPPLSYEICCRAGDDPDEAALIPFMFAFLVADVRNALTRDPGTSERRRMLLFGGGLSGRIAVHLQMQRAPGVKIVVVETSAERARLLRELGGDAVRPLVLPGSFVERLNRFDVPKAELNAAIGSIVDATRSHFDGRAPDLILDASSGNSAALWSDARVLAPDCHCIVFGFGSDEVRLDAAAIQHSGLRLMMSRGVGDLQNRAEVMALLHGETGRFVHRALASEARRLPSLEDAVAFIREQHARSAARRDVPLAFMTP